jgi:hypothetical protein
MHISALGKQVQVVNRVKDEQGNPVPYDAWIDGTVLVIQESAMVPEGVARIIVHSSMYKIDPISYTGQYKLGVKDWGMDVTPISKSEASPLELVTRENLTPDRQFGFKREDGKQLKPVRINNPIRRHDPIAANTPGPRQDGAYPAGFGEGYSK